MAIASMIVQPANNRINEVAAALGAMYGITVHTTTPKQEVIVVVEAKSLAAVAEIAKQVERMADVLGVFPAYITTADQVDGQ